MIFSQSFYSIILFAVLQGIATGVQAVSDGIVWPNYFGTLHLGSIRGITTVGTVISSSVGPILFSLLFERFGSYGPALFIITIIPLVGVILGLFSKKPAEPIRQNNV